jgi:hypothetical protein
MSELIFYITLSHSPGFSFQLTTEVTDPSVSLFTAARIVVTIHSTHTEKQQLPPPPHTKTSNTGIYSTSSQSLLEGDPRKVQGEVTLVSHDFECQIILVRFDSERSVVTLCFVKELADSTERSLFFP